MKTGFSLWELTYREFPVSLTGFGFTVRFFYSLKKSVIPVMCVAKCIKLGLNAVYRFQGVKMFEQIVTNKVDHIIESSNLT